jgi:hypothetical protein
MARDNSYMSRKQFLKKSSAAMLGAGLAVQNLAESNGADIKVAGWTPKSLGRTGIRITPIGFGTTCTMSLR